MTAAEHKDFLSGLYQNSMLPVLLFNDEMNIIWYNNVFENYFSAERIKNETLPALFQKTLKQTLLDAPGFSAKFDLKISSADRLSSEVNLLVFPAELENGSPVLFSAYIDDLTDQRRQVLRRTYLGLLEASKLKDDDTGNHIKRVGAYARRLSEEIYKLKLDSQVNIDFIENIHFLAPMHDVGKIGTPDGILNKKGPLDESEWRIMKEHTINGALILANYPDPMAMEIARAHHEKWDGSGYPYQLDGEFIPLSARITAIADVYDALRMERSYKKAFSHERAVEIITGDRGTHFDPTLIDIFMSISDTFNSIYTALADTNTDGDESVVEEIFTTSASNDEAEAEVLEELEEL